MNKTRYRRQLHLSPPEYESVLLQMNARCSQLEAHNHSRRRRRHAYKLADIPLHITHPQGGTGQFLVFGRKTTTGLTSGSTYYVSTTLAGITATAPSATLDIVRIVGHALSTTVLFFNPDQTYIEIA